VLASALPQGAQSVAFLSGAQKMYRTVQKDLDDTEAQIYFITVGIKLRLRIGAAKRAL
jgi:hypothetical protein